MFHKGGWGTVWYTRCAVPCLVHDVLLLMSSSVDVCAGGEKQLLLMLNPTSLHRTAPSQVHEYS